MTAPSGLSSGLRRCSLPPALGSRAGPDPCWLRSARQGRAAGGQSVKRRTGPTQQPVSMGVRDPCPPAPSLRGWGVGGGGLTLQAAGALGGSELRRDTLRATRNRRARWGRPHSQPRLTLSSNQRLWIRDRPPNICEVSPVTETPPPYIHVLVSSSGGGFQEAGTPRPPAACGDAAGAGGLCGTASSPRAPSGSFRGGGGCSARARSPGPSQLLVHLPPRGPRPPSLGLPGCTPQNRQSASVALDAASVRGRGAGCVALPSCSALSGPLLFHL